MSMQPESARDELVSELERRIIQATENGMPLVARPYDAIAAEVGATADEVKTAMRSMLDRGIIRRLGAVPNHYALGVTANGMSVWNVPDDKVAELGRKVGALDFVSHSYERPRHADIWDYNLFAMVHGRDREAVEKQVAEIAALLGDDCMGHTILYSSRLLKKTGLRLHTDPGKSTQKG